MEAGQLVPLETVLDLIKGKMTALAKTAKGFLIDGYPREQEQGVMFEKFVAPCKAVLYFDVSDVEMTAR